MKMKLDTIAHIIPEKISSYENLLEELDAPGEYFYDKQEKKLYLYPNGTISDMSTILLSQEENLIEV